MFTKVIAKNHNKIIDKSIHKGFKKSFINIDKNSMKNIPKKPDVKLSQDLLKAYSFKQYEKLFQSIEDARSYAFEKILEPLTQNNPFEYAVAIDSKNGIGRVLFEVKGGESKVGISKAHLLTDNSEVVHGHPSYPVGTLAQPLSFNDFAFLVKNNLKKITALNKKGEFCSLTKTENFSSNNIDLEQMEKLFNKKVFRHNLKNDNLDAYDLLGVAQSDFWQEYAPVLGLKYETNFAHLSQ